MFKSHTFFTKGVLCLPDGRLYVKFKLSSCDALLRSALFYSHTLFTRGVLCLPDSSLYDRSRLSSSWALLGSVLFAHPLHKGSALLT